MNETKEETIKKESTIHFPEGSLEKLLDYVHVGSQVTNKLYPTLVTYIDENSLDAEGFDVAMLKAKKAWEDARGLDVPKNSTFRSAVSVIKSALVEDVPLFDDHGNIKGKTALAKEVKAKRDSSIVMTKELADKKIHTHYVKIIDILNSLSSNADKTSLLNDLVLALTDNLEELKEEEDDS